MKEYGKWLEDHQDQNVQESLENDQDGYEEEAEVQDGEPARDPYARSLEDVLAAYGEEDRSSAEGWPEI